jgi:hypothetical protein
MASVWTVPGLVERFIVLHGQRLSHSQLANALSGEFNVRLTRSATISKTKRLKLEPNTSFVVKKTNTKKLKVPAAKRVPKPPSLPKEPTLPPEAKPVRLLDLRENMCRYPFGSSPDILFCGRKPQLNSPYCAVHRTLMYAPPKERRQ